jgi:hypothetical protein
LRRLCLVFPRCLLSNRSHFSLLNIAYPEWFPHGGGGGASHSRFTNNNLPNSRCGQNYLQWPVFLHFHLLLCLQSLLQFWRGPTPPRCPDTRFWTPVRRLDCSLHNLQPYGLSEGFVEFCSASSLDSGHRGRHIFLYEYVLLSISSDKFYRIVKGDRSSKTS